MTANDLATDLEGRVAQLERQVQQALEANKASAAKLDSVATGLDAIANLIGGIDTRYAPSDLKNAISSVQRELSRISSGLRIQNP